MSDGCLAAMLYLSTTRSFNLRHTSNRSICLNLPYCLSDRPPPPHIGYPSMHIPESGWLCGSDRQPLIHSASADRPSNSVGLSGLIASWWLLVRDRLYWHGTSHWTWISSTRSREQSTYLTFQRSRCIQLMQRTKAAQERMKERRN